MDTEVATSAVFELTKSSLDGDAVHVYSARYAPAPYDAGRTPSAARSVGKGCTDAEARASAIGEAVERMSAYYRGDERRLQATYAELGPQAIHPNDCMLFSEAQYADRPDPQEALRQRIEIIPERFPEDVPVSWSVVRSAVSGDERMIPTAYCYYAFPEPSAAFCRMDYNGHAAGGSIEDAMLRAFLELAERDAVSIWWYNEARRPDVDLDSFSDPFVDRLRETYRACGRDVWVLDVRSDLNIPTFAAISAARPDEWRFEPILYGFGADLEPAAALRRALTEVSQALPAVLKARVQGVWEKRPPASERMDFWPSEDIHRHPYLTPDAATPRLRACDYGASTRDVRDDLQRCLEIADGLDLDVLVLDQSRSDLALPAVKMIIPGLRSFSRRLAPGRLFDVPVKLGWHATPRSEGRMNPEPIVI